MKNQPAKTIYCIYEKNNQYFILHTDTETSYVSRNGCVYIDNYLVNDNFLLGDTAFYDRNEAEKKLESILLERIKNEAEKFWNHIGIEEHGNVVLSESLKKFGCFEFNPLYAALAYIVKQYIKN